MCEKCGTLHLSNYSIGIQYGGDIPITACTCECHLAEDNIHGNAARDWKKSMENMTKQQDSTEVAS